jgi:hypothetical protein
MQLSAYSRLPVKSLRADFPTHLPHKPYCTDDFAEGLRLRQREIAIRHRFIGFNGPSSFQWMTFDIDRPGAFYAANDAVLPCENVVMVNRDNGHAHLAYLMKTPIAKHQAARQKPLDYFAAVERGFTKRLGADPHYVGLIAKNPAHGDWLVEWRRQEAYSLEEMADWLHEGDTRKDRHLEAQFGAGRNVTVFEELRQIGYREVTEFQRAGKSFEEFRQRVETVGRGINLQFPVPLGYAEIRAIAKSIAKWIWKRFSPAGRSSWASKRGKAGNAKKWANHVAAAVTKPWEALGISRRTYYRRKASGALV